ncbi:membrane protein [Gordonia phage LittleFella]|nr:membrane protein [Gordonia phage LittleFella]
MTVLWVVLIGVGGLILGFAIGNQMAWSKWRDYIRQAEYTLDRAEADRLKAESDLRQMQNDVDAIVEKKFQQRLAEWTPTVDDVREEWKRAERMALKRQTMDGGRLYPPVVSEGEPSRVSQITFGSPPLNPADPK